MPHFKAERLLLRQGHSRIAGVDEVGRGPLAGPVAAAAVILDPRDLPKGIDDSKLLDAAAREAGYHLILAKAVAVGIGLASAREIDRLNIRQATFLAMRRALAALALAPDHALIDGSDAPLVAGLAVTAIVKGDASSLSIAAASVVAKVTRDRLMTRLDGHHPQYGFARHKGYATPEHREALRRHGPSIAHRISFAPCRQDGAPYERVNASS